MIDAQDNYGTRLTDLHYLSHPPSPTQTVTKKPSIWILLFSALLGGLGSYTVFSLLLTPSFIREIKSLQPLQNAAVLLSIPIAVWTAIFIHEAGHLCAGILAGMRPLFLLAGPLKVSFENSKLNIHLNKVFSTWGGLALATPREGSNRKWSLPTMIAGGPLASLILALVAGSATYQLTGWYRFPIGILAIMSLLIFIATLLPIRAGGFDSDGAQLLQLVRGSTIAKAKHKISIVVGESIAGVRPRDWSTNLLEEAIAEVSDPLTRVSAHFMLAEAAEDRDDKKKTIQAYERFAKQLHDGGLQAYPAMMRNDLIFPIVIHIVEHFRDTSLAEQWMSLCNGSTYYKYMELLAKATIAEANGDYDASRSFANEALNNLPSTPGVPPKRIERLKQLTAPTT